MVVGLDCVGRVNVVTKHSGCTCEVHVAVPETVPISVTVVIGVTVVISVSITIGGCVAVVVGIAVAVVNHIRAESDPTATVVEGKGPNTRWH
jgi:hypothetical protein